MVMPYSAWKHIKTVLNFSKYNNLFGGHATSLSILTICYYIVEADDRVYPVNLPQDSQNDTIYIIVLFLLLSFS